MYLRKGINYGQLSSFVVSGQYFVSYTHLHESIAHQYRPRPIVTSRVVDHECECEEPKFGIQP